MPSSRDKGNRRERQCAELYEQAGYKVEKSAGQRWDRTDWYGHFDLMAFRPDGIRFVQVKSNTVSGISAVNAWARLWSPPCVRFEFAVCYDNEGWRLIQCQPDADSYTTVVDERDDSCAMGDLVVEYLEPARSEVTA